MPGRSLYEVYDRQLNGRFGDLLRHMRDEEGLTQEEIVAALEQRYDIAIDRSQISRWFSSGRVDA